MKKIFISTPLDESIVLPKDVTHHILHVFRHNIEKPITVTGSDDRCGIYQINDEINGLAQASLIEYIDSPTSMHRTILVQSYLKGEKLEWVLQKLQSLMLIPYILYLHRTVLLSTMQKITVKI